MTEVDYTDDMPHLRTEPDLMTEVNYTDDMPHLRTEPDIMTGRNLLDQMTDENILMTCQIY